MDSWAFICQRFGYPGKVKYTLLPFEMLTSGTSQRASGAYLLPVYLPGTYPFPAYLILLMLMFLGGFFFFCFFSTGFWHPALRNVTHFFMSAELIQALTASLVACNNLALSLLTCLEVVAGIDSVDCKSVNQQRFLACITRHAFAARGNGSTTL